MSAFTQPAVSIFLFSNLRGDKVQHHENTDTDSNLDSNELRHSHHHCVCERVFLEGVIYQMKTSESTAYYEAGQHKDERKTKRTGQAGKA